jgi:SAM-dependent methyltransferase
VSGLFPQTDIQLVTPGLESPPCNVCGSSEYRVLRPARARPTPASDLVRTFSSSSDAPLSYQLVACSNCGLQFVSPRLRAEAVLEGYAEGSDEAFVSQIRGRELTFGKCLDRITRAWRGSPGRLLDIGTGSGAFLHVARERGWQVEGCEPNRWLCEWALGHYGLAIRPGTVFEQNYPSHAYDVVSLWDVLEHTPDPKREIQEAGRLLKPGGLLVVNYPDIGSWIARLMGARWVFLLDVHLYYFTRATIRRLLEGMGFAIVTVAPHIQWLGLRYILHRASPYLGVRLEGPSGAASRRGAADPPVPYWMGQTLVIARKVR